MKKIIGITICGLLLFLAIGCTGGKLDLILATTTSTADTGLLDKLLPVFEKKYNITVKTIAVGTGEALKMGERGDADVLLVHARDAERKFVADGYGVNRREVMYNDFVLIGPPPDPAAIKNLPAVEAFQRIYENKVVFVSRGDDSGTHRKERELWQKAKATPQGAWYIEAGQGMGETIRIAHQKQGYALADRGTYLSLKRSVNLVILSLKETILLNHYGVIAVNPSKLPEVNYQNAIKFIEFITSEEGQKMIGDFGRDKFGEPLFTPAAK